MKNLPFNWFDIFLLIWLVLGVFRGRKRGMSEELITFIQWIAIVLAGAFAYRPLGNLLHQHRFCGLLTAYILSYITIGIIVSAIFVGVKRAIGGKLIGSDVFGKSEYYLGMPAGMLRFACMLLAALALLNARFYSRQEILAAQNFQKDVYGSEFFPGLQTIQSIVFEQSLAGPPLKKYLRMLLIVPTAPEGVGQFKQKDWNPVP